MSRRQEQYRRDQAGGERDLGPGTGGRPRASHRLEPVHLRGDNMHHYLLSTSIYPGITYFSPPFWSPLNFGGRFFALIPR